MKNKSHTEKDVKIGDKYIGDVTITMNLYSNDLLQELVDFGKEAKAKMVYHKCLRRGKKEIAQRIAKKYNLKINHDSVDAFAYMIQSLNGA